MDRGLRPIADIFALNTDLIVNCLDGVTEAQANQRLVGGGNSIAFLLAHLTDARHYVASLVGAPVDNPLESTLAEARSIEDVEKLPPLSELQTAWISISRHLTATFEGLDRSELAQPTEQSFPIAGEKVVDAIAFLAQHDSYHVGQIAFIRRQLGLPGMHYERAGPNSAV